MLRIQLCRFHPSIGLKKEEGGNMVAHSLAKHARNLLEDLYWIEKTPLPATYALYCDSLHINK